MLFGTGPLSWFCERSLRSGECWGAAERRAKQYPGTHRCINAVRDEMLSGIAPPRRLLPRILRAHARLVVHGTHNQIQSVVVTKVKRAANAQFVQAREGPNLLRNRAAQEVSAQVPAHARHGQQNAERGAASSQF
jgi:hypothetical protein